MAPGGGKSCPLCGSGDVSLLIEIGKVPATIGVQWHTREAALACPRGEISLAYCAECRFIFNTEFDTGRLVYSESYENPLYFSPFFREYSKRVAERLIERYDLRGKKIIEIGCGKGYFLSLLCELGENEGIGFDPSYEETREDAGGAGRIRVIKDFYSEKYSQYTGDMVLCRHVLEHIPNPVGFLEAVRRAIGERRDTVVYFEVPHVGHILRNLSVGDIIYEHCSYFGEDSLAFAFSRCGFEVNEIRTEYGGQFLGLEARPGEAEGGQVPERDPEFERYVEAFPQRYRARLASWREKLSTFRKEGGRTVLWGAGAKGICFLNLLKVEDEIAYVVDVNPHKQGLYVPGTGQCIVAPEFLREYRPARVLVTNPNYVDEIRASLEDLELTSKIVTL